MVRAYLVGETCREAAARFSLCPGACKLALRALGVPARPPELAARKYDLNHAFFHTIDSEEKALDRKKKISRLPIY
jgi:hypothetical protein